MNQSCTRAWSRAGCIACECEPFVECLELCPARFSPCSPSRFVGAPPESRSRCVIQNEGGATSRDLLLLFFQDTTCFSKSFLVTYQALTRLRTSRFTHLAIASSHLGDNHSFSYPSTARTVSRLTCILSTKNTLLRSSFETSPQAVTFSARQEFDKTL
jgi:hypothetical protein